MKSFIS
ncbi:unnamed protein product [Linum tenue]|nr:unnamed protein product [Linum tenue]